MGFSSLMGEGSLGGEGSIGGEGSLAGEGSLGGEGSAGAGGDGSGSAYLSGALITTRDGIVGSWTPPEEKPDDGPIDTGAQMRRWEARVRAHVLDFELLSAFRLAVDVGDKDRPAAARLSGGYGAIPLVELVRPSTDYLLKKQLVHVYNHADLRRDRAAEILTQIKGIEIFLGRGSPLHPERHRRTLELLDAFFRALVSVEMRIKHALAVPRPMEFSWQLMPMIQTPGHGSFPAGHAAESFMLATVLSALMRTGGTRYAHWDAPLARLAARISVNRVIAGVHFPVDLAAGLVLGLTVSRYFIELAKGEGAKFTPREFVGEAYADRDFPWSQFSWAEILKPNVTLPDFVATGDTSFTLDPIDNGHSPLCWLWNEAVKEWQ
jgi:hypothetical protein